MPQKINQKQISGAIYASGYLTGATAGGVKNLVPAISSGLTYNGSNTYTVVTKGIYFIHGQQLIQNGASAVYLHIRINSTTARYAYMPASTMGDMSVTETKELNVGDTIDFYQQNAASTTWDNQHSAYQIHLIKRTD